MNLLILLAEAITRDGGISADYTLVLVIAICTGLTSIIFTLILNSINSIKKDVETIRKDFHSFVEEQKNFNGTMHERTKNL